LRALDAGRAWVKVSAPYRLFGADPLPYLRALLEAGGPERLVWGSDWPVLTLAGTYQDWFALAREGIAVKQESAVPAVMGNNALRFYRPKTRHIHA